jgi:hypothetical protein
VLPLEGHPISVPSSCLKGLTWVQAAEEAVVLPHWLHALQALRHNGQQVLVLDATGAITGLHLPQSHTVYLGDTHTLPVEDSTVETLIHGAIATLPQPLHAQAWQQWQEASATWTVPISSFEGLLFRLKQAQAGLLLRPLRSLQQGNLFAYKEGQPTFDLHGLWQHHEQASLWVLNLERMAPHHWPFVLAHLGHSLQQYPRVAQRLAVGLHVPPALLAQVPPQQLSPLLRSGVATLLAHAGPHALHPQHPYFPMVSQSVALQASPLAGAGGEDTSLALHGLTLQGATWAGLRFALTPPTTAPVANTFHPVGEGPASPPPPSSPSPSVEHAPPLQAADFISQALHTATAVAPLPLVAATPLLHEAVAEEEAPLTVPAEEAPPTLDHPHALHPCLPEGYAEALDAEPETDAPAPLALDIEAISGEDTLPLLLDAEALATEEAHMTPEEQEELFFLSFEGDVNEAAVPPVAAPPVLPSVAVQEDTLLMGFDPYVAEDAVPSAPSMLPSASLPEPTASYALVEDTPPVHDERPISLPPLDPKPAVLTVAETPQEAWPGMDLGPSQPVDEAALAHPALNELHGFVATAQGQHHHRHQELDLPPLPQLDDDWDAPVVQQAPVNPAAYGFEPEADAAASAAATAPAWPHWEGAPGAVAVAEPTPPVAAVAPPVGMNKALSDLFPHTEPAAAVLSATGFSTGFSEGQRVRHPQYGEGVVEAVVPLEDRAVLSVQFAQAGKRILDPQLSPLQAL